MQRCCVNGCVSHYECNKKEKISFFEFPLHDEILLKKWLRQIDLNLVNWRPSLHHRICSLHFREQDLVSYANVKRRLLKLTSVPTIFPNYPVEIINPKSTNDMTRKIVSFRKSVGFGKIDNVVGCNLPLATGQSLIMIPSQFCQQLPLYYSINKLIGQISNENCVDNSTEGIYNNYMRPIGSQNSFMLSRNSAQYMDNMKKKMSPTDDQRYINHMDGKNFKVIEKNNGVEPSCDNGNIMQATIDCANQVLALPNSIRINQQFIKQKQNNIVQQQIPACQPRLRKILPKSPSFDPNTLPTAVTIFPNYDSKSMINSTPKPDIVIIPRIGASNGALSVHTSNKKPILRITINKEYSLKETIVKNPHSPCQIPNRCLRSNAKMKIGSMIDNSLKTEMTINNVTTNKAATFKLNSQTGEITVSISQLNDLANKDSSSKFTKTKRKVHNNNSMPRAPKYRQRGIEVEQECVVVQKKLRDKRVKQKPKEGNTKVQHVTELNNSIGDTWSEKHLPATETSRKRKQTKNNIVSFDKFENPLHQVKRIKNKFEDDIVYRRPRDLSEKNVYGVINRNNGASKFTKSTIIKPFVCTENRKLGRKINS